MTNEIVEKLKLLTIIEAVELVSQIEETFGVDGSSRIMMPNIAVGRVRANPSVGVEDKTKFDVVLESIFEDKRVAALKAVRSLTSLGLKEAKDFCSSLPKVMKEQVSKEEAEVAKKELEEAGGKVVIKLNL